MCSEFLNTWQSNSSLLHLVALYSLVQLKLVCKRMDWQSRAHQQLMQCKFLHIMLGLHTHLAW